MKSKFEKELKSRYKDALKKECPNLNKIKLFNSSIKDESHLSKKHNKVLRRITKIAAGFVIVVISGYLVMSGAMGGLSNKKNSAPLGNSNFNYDNSKFNEEPRQNGGYNNDQKYPAPACTNAPAKPTQPGAPNPAPTGIPAPGENNSPADNNNNTNDGSDLIEQPTSDTSKESTSTFSVDVDTASYSYIRKYINMGIRPPKDTIRIEEMINYFSYKYPKPTGDAPFSVTTEVGKCPWDNSKYIAMIGLKGKEVAKEGLPLSNLVFLIDVSGSMSDPNKLPLLQSSFKLLVDQLTENDRISIVVYAGASGVVLDGARGNEKEKILASLDSLTAGGSTAGADGIQKAYDLAQKYMIAGGNNRVILATDGDFNVGISDVNSLKTMIEEKRKSGINLSVLGFGTGNDSIMETLADSGNGNYAFIDSINEARKVLVQQMAGTLLTIAKDVKIQVNFNPETVAGYRLVGYENRILNNDDFTDDTKDAGEIGSGHTVTAIYEIIPAAGLKENDKLFDISLRYKKPQENVSSQLDFTTSFKPGETNSSDFNFASAVAGFGLLLRDSQYKGNVSVSSIMDLATVNIGEDADGYRKEFIELVRKYQDIK